MAGDNLLNQLAAQFQPLDGLDPECFAQIQFCRQLFSRYCRGHQLAGDINQALTVLLPIMIEIQFNSPKWLWNNHPIIDFLSLIQQHSIGWQSASNKASQRFLSQFTAALNDIYADWQQQPVDFTDNAITQFFSCEQRRMAKLEQRLIASESGSLRAKRSQELCIQILNNKMRSKKLPKSISYFLQQSWHDSIILLLINSDDIQAEYHRLSKLTEILISTFQPFDHSDHDQQQRIYRRIANLQQELSNAIISLAHQPEKRQQTLNIIEQEHFKILKGNRITGDPFTLLSNDDPFNSAVAKVSGSLLKKVKLIKEGQWFQTTVDGQVKSFKLLLKLSDSQQLLFSNHIGVKSCQYSFKKFAYKLSNNSIKPLADKCRIEQTASILVEQLLKNQRQPQENPASIKALQLAKQHQLEKRRIDARKKALAEIKTLQNKGKKGNSLDNSLSEKPPKKAAASTPPEISLSDYQKHSVLLHQLHIGGIIRFTRNKQNIDCKLAATTQQANKYIFVNRQGIKECEVLKQQLIIQLATKQAKIIANDGDIENALSNVANNIRNKQ